MSARERPSREAFQAATLLAHGGMPEAGRAGPVVPEIQPSTTFARDSDYRLEEPGGYLRSGTGNWQRVEELMCRLEGAAAARLYASGLAAATAPFQVLAPGDRVVVPDRMYHGLRDWLTEFCGRWGIGLASYPAGDIDGMAAVLASEPARLVWVETPANPTWEVTDIAAAADLVHRAGALCAVDSTVATPLLTRPVDLGADLVVHSATKYLNGHSDVLGGVLLTARKDASWDSIAAQRTGNGAVMGVFEAWLLLRGLRTLDLRIERACDNAMAIARHFADDPRVAAVHYPGLPDHPGHRVAARQMSGRFGAMLSLRVRGGAQAALRVAGATVLFRPATSLGGVESLVEHRASVEGPGSPVPADLLRLSVGIESIDDLLADLDRALDAAQPGAC